MDIQNLNAFLQVSESRSFSGAALQLHITQPAVSKRVAILEQELGSRLFDRIGRTVSLTEAGRALLPHALAITRNITVAKQSVRDLSGEVSGHLRLATSHHIGLHRMPPVLQHFRSSTPLVKLEIEFMDSEQAYEAIFQGKAELGVVTLAPEEESNVVAIPVWPDPLDFMTTPGHPLASSTTVDLPTLAAYPAVLPGLGTYTGRIVKQLFEDKNLSLEITMATNYLETLRMLAAVGLGWTVLPRSMLNPQLTAISLPSVQIERTLGYIYHSHHSLSRAVKAFIDSINAVAG